MPLTTSIDSLVIYVLSRKEPPAEIAHRIDDFFLNYRIRLEDMPHEEIQDYADSLAKALTKPIRKLGDEASNHFSKIRRYAPETLVEGSCYSVEDMPFDNAEVIAGAIRKLDRNTILEVYDSLLVRPDSRSRIISHVYGNVFPLDPLSVKPIAGSASYAVSSMEELMKKRQSLIAYDSSRNYYTKEQASSLWRSLGKHKTTVRYAFAAAALVGVGLLGTVAIKGRNEKKTRSE